MFGMPDKPNFYSWYELLGHCGTAIRAAILLQSVLVSQTHLPMINTILTL